MNATAYRATGQLLGRALAEMGQTAAKPAKPARHWIAGYLTRDDASQGCVEMIANGEIVYRRDDPDIEKKDGLYWVTVKETAK